MIGADLPISVIIPVYNGERYLAEAIDSVLGQTCRPLEIIVVDDGSTDGSLGIAHRYPSPVQVIGQPHVGPGAARNHGVRIARGDFLAFLDADDRWPEDKLARQWDAFRQAPHLDMVLGQVRQLRDGAEWTAGVTTPWCPPDQLTAGYAAGAMLVRRAAFLRVGPFRTQWRLGEFIDWFARAREAGLAVACPPDLVLWRRMHDTNLGVRERTAAVDYTRVVRESLRRRRLAPRTDDTT
jgi:glycosyltransferase involved in cell wall biosynthesis